MKATSIGLAALLLMVIFGGVQTGSAPTDGEIPSPPIHEFQAVYRNEGTNSTFEVTFYHEPEVMDADEQVYAAYALKSRGIDSETWRWVQFLDEELVKFRSDRKQACDPNVCLTARWANTAKSPELFGLDIPGQVQKYGHAWYMNGLDKFKVDVDIEETEEGLWYHLDPVGEPGFDLLEGSLLFNPDETAPLIAEHGPEDHRTTYTRISYEQGDELPPIDNPRRVREPIPESRSEGWLFPGEGEDTFNVGYTHLELVHGLIRYEGTTGEGEMQRLLREGACINHYGIYPVAESRDPLEEPIEFVVNHVERRADVVVGVDDPEGNVRHYWEGEARWGGPLPRYSGLHHQDFPRERFCPDGSDRYWPQMSLGDAFDWAGEYMPERHELTNVGVDHSPGRTWRSPADGWNHYIFEYAPEQAPGNLPHYVGIDPDRNVFTRIEMQPEDFTFPPAYGD